MSIKKTTIVAAFVVACGATLSSCTDNDFDLSNLDATLGIGGGELTLPGNNSTDVILLEDMLDLGNSDLIQIVDGEYQFSKTPDKVEPVKVKISKFVENNPLTQDGSVDIVLSQDFVKNYAGQTVNPSDMGYTIDFKGDISAFDYDYELPDEVKSFSSMGIDVDANLVINVPSHIKTFRTLTIQVPRYLDVDYLGNAGSFDHSTNTLTFSNYRPSAQMKLPFRLNKMKATQIDSRNYMKEQGGHVIAKGDVLIRGEVGTIVVPTTTTHAITGKLTMGRLNIKSITGTFNPTIKLNDVGSVTINSIPDFLEDEEVVADLDNPQLTLSIVSTMPLSGTLAGTVKSSTSNAVINLSGNNAIKVKTNGDGTPCTTRVLICRHTNGINTSDYDQVIVQPTLSTLINKLREGMKVDFHIDEAKANSSETATILLDHEYELTPSYKFSCPLAFGPQATILYRDTLDGWNNDLKDLDLAENTYINIEAQAENQIPANLVVEAYAIDTNSKKLDGINVEVPEVIKGSKDGKSVVSPLTIKVTQTAADSFHKLDGIIFRLKASSDDTLQGITLNSNKQSLIFRNITIKIMGKVIYDAN